MNSTDNGCSLDSCVGCKYYDYNDEVLENLKFSSEICFKCKRCYVPEHQDGYRDLYEEFVHPCQGCKYHVEEGRIPSDNEWLAILDNCSCCQRGMQPQFKDNYRDLFELREKK